MISSSGLQCSAQELTKQELNGAVQQGDHIVGVGSERAAELACHAKVTDLQLPTVVVQDVGGFQIPMEDPVGVQVSYAFQQLIHQVLHLPTFLPCQAPFFSCSSHCCVDAKSPVILPLDKW